MLQVASVSGERLEAWAWTNNVTPFETRLWGLTVVVGADVFVRLLVSASTGQ